MSSSGGQRYELKGMPEKNVYQTTAITRPDRQNDSDGVDDEMAVGGGESGDALDSTGQDQRDMHRLGRRQEMQRNFRSLSILSFTIVVQATWEFVLV